MFESHSTSSSYPKMFINSCDTVVIFEVTRVNPVMFQINISFFFFL